MRIEQVLSIIAVLFSSISIHAASSDFKPKHKEWKAFPEYNCKLAGDGCYNDAAKVLEDHSDEIPVAWEGQSAELNAYILSKEATKNKLGENHFHVLQKKKPAFVFVIAHGLYGNSFQFLSLTYFLKSLNQNVIAVTLPGHGFDDVRAQDITFEDWREEIRKVTNLAKHLGDKVILFGQSTGGVLSLGQSIQFPASVQGLIMMEPALKVRGSVEAAACVGKTFFTNAQQGLIFAKMLGLSVPERPINVQMGCQVGRIFETLSSESFNTDLATAGQIAERVKVPSLTITNINDNVVDNETNRLLAAALEKAGQAQAFEITEKDMQHGIFQAYRPQNLNKLVFKYLNSFFDFKNTLQKEYDAEQAIVKKLKYVTEFVSRFHNYLSIELMYGKSASYFSGREIQRIQERYFLDEQKIPTFYECTDVLSISLCTEFLIDREDLFIVMRQFKNKFLKSYGKYPELKDMQPREITKFYLQLEKRNPGDAKLMKEVTRDFYSLDQLKFPPLSKDADILHYRIYGKLKNPKDLEEKK